MHVQSRLIKYLAGTIIFALCTGIVISLMLKEYPIGSPGHVNSKAFIYNYSIWDWTPLEDYSDSKIHDNLSPLSLLNIKRIYLSVNDLVDIQELPEGVEKNRKKSLYFNLLRTYIKAANSKGIKVEALVGDKKWSDPDYRYLTKIASDSVEEYNANAEVGTLIEGIQFDIEPEFDNITTDQKKIIINDFLDTVNYIKENLEKSGSKLILGFAIPYWYDGENQNIPETNYMDKIAYPAFHIIDLLANYHSGYIALMSYRNQASGQDGAIEHSIDEIAYVEERESKVIIIIGQELNNVEPSKITFYSKPFSELLNETLKINDHFSKNSGFGGIAIHDMQGFLDIKK